MNILSPNSIFLVFLFTFSGCATSSYKSLNESEVVVTPDRVQMECADVSDENDIYMFILYLLDDAKTVMTGTFGKDFDEEVCLTRKAKIDHVLKTGQKIHLAGPGSQTSPRMQTSKYVHFPKHGNFPENGRHFQLFYVYNEKGHCFGAFKEDNEPCPGDWAPWAYPPHLHDKKSE